jgi:uncharacterized protein YcbX
MSLRFTGLRVYPVKSAGGISPDAWPVDGFGLVHDRRWMVVDSRGQMVSQRTHPRLALVRPTVHADRLTLDAPGTAPLDLALRPTGSVMVKATVWDDTCDAVWLGPRPAKWFSDVLGSRCELVYMPEATVRPADPAYAPDGIRVSFADAFPFLLISEESLADLNAKLIRPLPMNRFRPNLVIAGGEPYVEDTLQEFATSGITFRAVKPCGRCVVTTTDQETAQRGIEPLRTLATYRKDDGEVMFGQNVVHLGTGHLTVGAPLLV